MGRLLIAAAAAALLAGCSETDHPVRSCGYLITAHPQNIELYSSGIRIEKWHTIGDVRLLDDGIFQFIDQVTSDTITVSGTVLIEPLDL